MSRKKKKYSQNNPKQQEPAVKANPLFSNFFSNTGEKFTFRSVRALFVSHIPMFLLIILVGLLVYGNSMNGAFLIADDIPGLVQNPVITDFDQAWDTGKINIIFDSALFALGKGTPSVFHARSVIMHILNAILVLVFLSMIFNKSISLASALLFLVHPISTEAVSWISAWIYLALTMFTLLITIFFLLYRKTKKMQYMAISVILCVVYSLFFTDNWVFTIPPIVVIIDQLLVERRVNLKFQTIKNYIPLLTVGTIHAIYLLSTSLTERIDNLKNLYYNDVSKATPFVQRVPYTAYMIFKQLAFPRDLTIYHEGYVISSQLFAFMVIFFFVLTGAIIYFLFKDRVIAGLLSLQLVSILPSFSPVPVAWLMADRYLYRGSIFFCLLLAYLLYKIESKYHLSNLLKISFLVIFVILAIMTILRNNDWRSDRNLWESTKRVSPYSARVYNNLGDVYFKEKDFQSAITHFQIALQLKPDFADVVHNLGFTYLELGNVELAREYLLKSYEMNPYLYQSLYKLGYLEYKVGNFDKSLEYFTRTLEVNPSFTPAQEALNIVNALKLQQSGDKETVE